MAIPTVLSAPSGTLCNPLQPSSTLWSPLNPYNLAKSTWIFMKLELLGSDLVDPTYPGHPLWSISALWNPLEPSGALYIPIA